MKRICLLIAALLLCAAAACGEEETVFINPDGGKRYHSYRTCNSISKKYWAELVEIPVSKLQEEPYDALKLCTYCYVESFGYESHEQADLIRKAQQLVMQRYDRSQARMNGYAAEVGQSSGYTYVKLTPQSWEHPEFFVAFYEDGSTQVEHFECSLLDKYIDEQVAEKQALFRNWTVTEQYAFATWLRTISQDYLDALPLGTAHLLKHQYGLPTTGDIAQDAAVAMARSQVTEKGVSLDRVSHTSVSYYVDDPEAPVWHVRFYERAVLRGEAYIAARAPAICYINPNGGSYYHAVRNCRSMREEYHKDLIELPLNQMQTADNQQYRACPKCYAGVFGLPKTEN